MYYMVMPATEGAAKPLTQLSEEAKMVQSTVSRFADKRIGPHVREMDSSGVFRGDLIKDFFKLGLMRIVEKVGGQGERSPNARSLTLGRAGRVPSWQPERTSCLLTAGRAELNPASK